MDSNRRSARVERLEVVHTGRRRRGSKDQKLKIVLESLQAPRQVAATARRYGISHSLLQRWRRSFGSEPKDAQATDGDRALRLTDRFEACHVSLITFSQRVTRRLSEHGALSFVRLAIERPLRARSIGVQIFGANSQLDRKRGAAFWPIKCQRHYPFLLSRPYLIWRMHGAHH
ncbi:transposase [Bradyrhizobium sp. USDA 4529]